MILFDWLRVSSDLGIFAVRRTYDVPITHPRIFFCLLSSMLHTTFMLRTR